jgi:hypothetical protein
MANNVGEKIRLVSDDNNDYLRIIAQTSLLSGETIAQYQPLSIYNSGRDSLLTRLDYTKWALKMLKKGEYSEEQMENLSLLYPRRLLNFRIEDLDEENESEKTAKELALFTEKLTVNSVSLSSGTYAIYGPPSFLNHSCHPNSIFTISNEESNNNALEIEALRDIKQGDEITRSYVDDARGLAKKDRQQFLEKYCYFKTECNCYLCKEDKVLCGNLLCNNTKKRVVKSVGIMCSVCKKCWFCSSECKDSTLNVHSRFCN